MKSIAKEVFSVAAATAVIKAALAKEQRLNNILIRGQITNWKKHSSGHCYFSLQDDKAMLRVVMFRGQASRLRFQPASGLAVIASGSINLYERDGQYQLYCEYLAPDGVGEQHLAFEQLKTKLTAEGLFAAERKRALPAFPRAIGVVTSATGAAINDIVKVCERRYPGILIRLFPVQVQGDIAAASICRALAYFNANSHLADVLIVGRGGGGQEDLAAFNDEGVVRAVVNSVVPVISAVGHEHDYCLCDFAADCRAATPSQAAELAVPDLATIAIEVQRIGNRLQTIGQKMLAIRKANVDNLTIRLKLVVDRYLLPSWRIRLDNDYERLKTAIEAIYEKRWQQINSLAEKLAILNPLLIKQRGFSIVYNEGKDRVITNAGNVVSGENIYIELSAGGLTAKVLTVEEH